jgi:hypothetical protein
MDNDPRGGRLCRSAAIRVPSTMMTRTLAAGIALIAWTGLAVQFHASFVHFQTAPASVWAMPLYFTVIAQTAAARENHDRVI